MQLTPNYRLRKPDGTDPVDVQDLNDNMDVLDAEVVKKLDKTGDASNVVNKFSQAGTRTNLSSGEKLSITLGKIMKWFADLKTVAFSGKYSDLTDRPTIPTGGIADKSKIIDNLDDIAANTQAGYMAGALAVKELNSDLEWKLAGTVVGTGEIELPVCREIYVVAKYNTQCVGLNIPYISLTDNTLSYNGGGYGTDNSFALRAVFDINKTKIKLTYFVLSGNNQLNNAAVSAYYR